jgi:hypothetical protein
MSAGSFLHNGAANSLAQVMSNVEHRSAGTNGADTLVSATKRDQLIKFLRSIDINTVPIPGP